MKQIQQEIKSSMSSCTLDELQARIPGWRDQFRQRGISIIALETLLNFYQETHKIVETQADEAYVSSQTIANVSPLDSDRRFNAMRTKADMLEKEKSAMKQIISVWKTRFFIALTVATIAVCGVITLLFIK